MRISDWSSDVCSSDLIALYLGWVRDDTYLSSLTSILTLIGIAFVVAHRFVAAMRRVEGFNLELKREVATATRELGETLQREHQLALAHGRAGERSSEEHTSELQSLMRISYAVFFLKKKQH